MAKLVPFGRRSLIDELFGDVNPGFFIRPLHGDTLPSQIKVEVKEDKDSNSVLPRAHQHARTLFVLSAGGGRARRIAAVAWRKDYQ